MENNLKVAPKAIEKDMVKMNKFLNKFEGELKILREERSFKKAEYFFKLMKKGQEIYAIADQEISGKLNLEGFPVTSQSMLRVSRGYRQLINTMLKYILLFFDQKSIYLDRNSAKEPSEREIEESIVNRNFYSRMFQREQQQGQTNILLAPTNSTMTPSQRAMFSDSASPSSFLDGPSSNSPTLYNNPTTTTSKMQNKKITITVPGVKNTDGATNQAPVKETKRSEEISSSEEDLRVEKEFEELMMAKKNIDKIQSSGTSNELKQVLRNLSETKRRGDLIVENEMDSDEDIHEELNIEGLRSEIMRVYEKGQRKTARKVLTYAEKNELQKLQQAKNQTSVGTEPDYKLIEAEKQSLLLQKEQEYEKILFTIKSENDSLKAKLEEMSETFNELKTETLLLQSAKAKFEFDLNSLQNENRNLKSENGSLTDKIERKKLKIQSLKEDISSLNETFASTKADAAKFVEEKTDLLNQISELKIQMEATEKQFDERQNELAELEENLRTKEVIIEQNEKDLAEREETISELGRLLEELKAEKEQLEADFANERGLIADLTARMMRVEKDFEEEQSLRNQAENQYQEIAAKQLEQEKAWELERKQMENQISTLNDQVSALNDQIAQLSNKMASNTTRLVQIEHMNNLEDQINRPTTRTDKVMSSKPDLQSAKSNKTSLAQNTQRPTSSKQSMNSQEDQLNPASLQDTKYSERRGEAFTKVNSGTAAGQYKATSVEMVEIAVGTEQIATRNIAIQTDGVRSSISSEFEKNSLRKLETNCENEDEQLSKIAAQLKELVKLGIKAPEIAESLRSLQNSLSHRFPRSSSLDHVHSMQDIKQSKQYLDATNSGDKKWQQQQHTTPSTPKNLLKLNPCDTGDIAQFSSVRTKTPTTTPKGKFEAMRRSYYNRSVDFTNNMPAYFQNLASEDETMEKKQGTVLLAPLGTTSQKKPRSRIDIDSLQSNYVVNQSHRIRALLEGQPSPLLNRMSKRQFPSVRHEITKAKKYFLDNEIDDEIYHETKKNEELLLNEMFGTLQEKIKSNPGLIRMFKPFSRHNSQEINSSQIQDPGLIVQESDEDSNQANNNQINFEEFKSYFLKFKRVHKKCGDDCTHLRRFYQKIGWQPLLYYRPEYQLPKTEINQLPKVFSKNHTIYHYGCIS